ncbi:hypothetical protein [Spirosoma oryzicola]|uniref:hypothetical protein n=1 Tax=Spirosoma oryzicola TaxID=2898794 RepID=UPI001E47A704|nr:hypothetical protein [Spirosoma oryzicola]UHG93187.1 hypothetical protein LQ777_09870 [Spirosoma oryzicola]
MIDPILLLSSRAVEMGNKEDPQSLFDFMISSCPRIHLAFDGLLPKTQTVTISLVKIDKDF